MIAVALVTCAVAKNATFSTPVALGPAGWGVQYYASFSDSTFALQVGSNVMLTRDGGKTFEKQPSIPGGISPHGTNLVRTAVGGLPTRPKHRSRRRNAQARQRIASGYLSMY